MCNGEAIRRNWCTYVRFSEKAIERVPGPRELFVVDGKTHVGLYDDTSATLPKLVEFMATALSGAS